VENGKLRIERLVGVNPLEGKLVEKFVSESALYHVVYDVRSEQTCPTCSTQLNYPRAVAIDGHIKDVSDSSVIVEDRDRRLSVICLLDIRRIEPFNARLTRGRCR
jgi:hypothetical protein